MSRCRPHRRESRCSATRQAPVTSGATATGVGRERAIRGSRVIGPGRRIPTHAGYEDAGNTGTGVTSSNGAAGGKTLPLADAPKMKTRRVWTSPGREGTAVGKYCYSDGVTKLATNALRL